MQLMLLEFNFRFPFFSGVDYIGFALRVDYHHSMSLLSRFFYKRPPDGLLELSDRVYGNMAHYALL